jgi:hypothetical protein
LTTIGDDELAMVQKLMWIFDIWRPSYLLWSYIYRDSTISYS